MTPHQPPSRRAAFTALVRDVRTCAACPGMHHARVLGEACGPLDARAIFVAEAVGRRGGALTGVPLTRDVSGQRFGAFLAIAGVERRDVFVTNAVLCNPLDAAGRNRAPRPSEVARCNPYLARTLDVVRAPVVVALGAVALAALGRIEPHQLRLCENVAATHPWRGRTLVPMYHPSRQSTLHRDAERQAADWRALGAIIRAASLYEGEAPPTMISA